MGFLDDIKAAPGPPRPICSVALWLDTATPEITAEFNAALSERAVTAKTIYNVMATKYGYTGQYQAVQRHRRAECVCDRS